MIKFVIVIVWWVFAASTVLARVEHKDTTAAAQAELNAALKAQAAAKGGSAEALGEGGDASIGEISLSTETEVPEQTPPLTVISSPSTAEMMVCFGLGGAVPDGAASGLWCRLQRELYAIHRSERLAAIGDYDPAARAYCSRSLHWKDYGSKEACFNEYRASLIAHAAARVQEVADAKKSQTPPSALVRWKRLSSSKP